MAKIVIEQPGVAPITLPLSPTAATHLGRAEDNTVLLVADEVSRHHAKVTPRGDAFVLTDLNSMNGTYVNRQRILERVLADGDEIWLGSRCRARFHADGPAPGTADAPMRAESDIERELHAIRERMEEAGQTMTLIVEQAATTDSGAGEPPPEAATPSPEQLRAMGHAFRRLEALLQASRQVASSFDLQARLEAVLDTAVAAVDAERGFVLLTDEETGALAVHVAREMGGAVEPSSPSMGIAGQAATTGEPLLVSDIRDHARLAARESVIQQRITSAMAVPLQVGDRILGSVYVDTRRPGTAFSREDLELFASVASQSAMAIDLVRMHEQMLENEKRRANLGRFLSPAIVEEVLKHDTALQLGGSKRVVTALFCDIRNFTPMAERLTPDELVALLNEHFTAMTGIIFRMQGTLDKYIGDEIMAVFGAPIAESDDALRAVRTALLIQAKNAELNTERAARGAPTFELGIGIASGEVIAGFVGSPERMEFTVVGDRVNTARRLCSVAKGGQVVIAEQTHAALGGALATRPIGPVSLKGKTATETAYEVLPGRPGTTAPDRGGPGLTG